MTADAPVTKGPRRDFASDAHGVAAVEFSLILPVALLIMALVVYGSQLYRVQRKVSLAAATVANLVAQGGNTSAACISTPELTQILAYPNLILYPYDATYLSVVVSELSITQVSGGATATVQWSYANGNGTQRPAGQQLSVGVGQQVPVNAASIVSAFTGPSSVANGTDVGNVIFAEVQYPPQHPFQPYDLYGTVAATTLYNTSVMIPRTNAGVTVQASCP